MVRNDELAELSTTTHEISDVIRELTEKQGYTQTAIAAKLKKAQSYVSLRLKGLKAWNIEELQQLALLLKYNDIFDLFDYIKDYTQRSQSPIVSPTINDDNDVPLDDDEDFNYTEFTRNMRPEDFGMAAYRDPYKTIESQTPTD